MGLFDWLSKPPSKDAFAKMVMDGIRRAGETGAISYDRDEFLLVGENQKAYLGNLYPEFCTAPKSHRSRDRPEDGSQLVCRHARVARLTSRMSGPIFTLLFGTVRTSS